MHLYAPSKNFIKSQLQLQVRIEVRQIGIYDQNVS